jgi:NAD(P)-dependent dehydrogenase (short-subunit alcohol dehydrogenase family)
MSTLDKFRLDGRPCVITGGAGLLGVKHAEAILDAGGDVILVDINNEKLDKVVRGLADRIGNNSRIRGLEFDITKESKVKFYAEHMWNSFGPISILINNAANNPKLEEGKNLTRLENFPLDVWQADFNVGVTGAFLMSREIGKRMARSGSGVIVNVASDLGVIAPDQRIYRKEGLAENEQPVKPVTYSVTKHALIGLTKYLATYWADKGVRVNSISPGGIFNNQPEEFVRKLSNLIPMGRMATPDEYKAAIVFLCSDASSYMTGQNLVIDGGRMCW